MAPRLVRWSVDLKSAWRYPFDSGFGPIDDCYALNVDGEMAWACYYSDFPIVKVYEAGIEGWRTDVRGATNLIVGPSKAALIGGYGPERDRVVLGQLSDGRFDPRSWAGSCSMTSPIFRQLVWSGVGLISTCSWATSGIG